MPYSPGMFSAAKLPRLTVGPTTGCGGCHGQTVVTTAALKNIPQHAMFFVSIPVLCLVEMVSQFVDFCCRYPDFFFNCGIVASFLSLFSLNFSQLQEWM